MERESRRSSTVLGKLVNEGLRSTTSGIPPMATPKHSNTCVRWMSTVMYPWRKTNVWTMSLNGWEWLSAIDQRKKKGVTLGGRGYGKLTQAAITKCTGYFGKAISAHPNYLEAMKNAGFATFHYAISTDEKPDHDLCPKGKESWCFYQKALAAGEVPGSHRTHVGTPLSEEVGAVVKDVYMLLGHTDHLGQCLMGKTQNSNKSLH